MKSIYSLTKKQLEDYFVSNNDKKFRAIQIFEWLYRKQVTSFDDMTNVNKQTIQKLKEDFIINTIKIVKKQEDKDVKKYLFELNDGNKIETVLMYHDYGTSICISSQIGCNM